MNVPLADEERTTSIGLARYAYAYLHAAMVVETNEPAPGSGQSRSDGSARIRDAGASLS